MGSNPILIACLAGDILIGRLSILGVEGSGSNPAPLRGCLY